MSNSRRRSTLGMGVIGDRVFIPGSPAITLPELLQEAELEVRDSPRSLSQKSLVLPARGDPFHTPIAAKCRVQAANVRISDQKVEVYGGDIGEREWTKEDWKHLDACFTDQRLEVGSRLADAEQNMLAPVDMVPIDDVVDKFVASKGGFEAITRFGELWSRYFRDSIYFNNTSETHLLYISGKISWRERVHCRKNKDLGTLRRQLRRTHLCLSAVTVMYWEAKTRGRHACKFQTLPLSDVVLPYLERFDLLRPSPFQIRRAPL